LRFAESFRVHGPISTSEFAAVSTPPPRNNSLRYSRGEEPLPSPFSAFLSESLRLCVNSSQPARRLEYSSAKSPPFPPPRPCPARPEPKLRHRHTHRRPGMAQSPAKSTWRLNAASSSRSELPREAFGVRPACWRCRNAQAARKREQAPRTPNASRNSAASGVRTLFQLINPNEIASFSPAVEHSLVEPQRTATRSVWSASSLLALS
jgi:hypothetical protein